MEGKCWGICGRGLGFEECEGLARDKGDWKRIVYERGGGGDTWRMRQEIDNESILMPLSSRGTVVPCVVVN